MSNGNIPINRVKEYDPVKFKPEFKPRKIGVSKDNFDTAVINLISRLTGKKVTEGELEADKSFMDARMDFTTAVQEEQKDILNALNIIASGSKEVVVPILNSISKYSVKIYLANLLLEQKIISEDEYNIIVYGQELKKPKEIVVEGTGGGTTETGAVGGEVPPSSPSAHENHQPADPAVNATRLDGGGNSGGASSGTKVTLPSYGIKTGWEVLDTILKPLDFGLGLASMLTQALQPFAPLGLSLWTMSEMNKTRQQLNSMSSWGGAPYTFNFSYPGWWQPPTLPSDIINNTTGVSPQIQAMMNQLSNQNMRFGLPLGSFPGASRSIFG